MLHVTIGDRELLVEVTTYINKPGNYSPVAIDPDEYYGEYEVEFTAYEDGVEVDDFTDAEIDMILSAIENDRV